MEKYVSILKEPKQENHPLLSLEILLLMLETISLELSLIMRVLVMKMVLAKQDMVLLLKMQILPMINCFFVMLR